MYAASIHAVNNGRSTREGFLFHACFCFCRGHFTQFRNDITDLKKDLEEVLPLLTKHLKESRRHQKWVSREHRPRKHRSQTADLKNADLAYRKQTAQKRTSTNSKILSKILPMQVIQR